MENRPRERSLFWPILLIGAGAIWLLANFNLIQDLSWVTLTRLWPLALIAAGLDMLFGRTHPLVSALIGLLTVGAAVALLVAGPRLGLAPATPQVKTERFSEPLEGATAAEITLGLSDFPTTISPLTDSSDLIDAELTHSGQVRFEVSGEAQRQVQLNYSSGPDFFFPNFTDESGQWRIALSPEVPLQLVVDVGSGTAELDLAGLWLTALNIDGGSGALNIVLPAANEEAYDVTLEGGSGAQSVLVPVSAAGALNYDGGSGSLRVDVADSAAVRLEVHNSGSGDVRVPSSWIEIENGEDDEGIWQSATYDDAEGQSLLIIVDDLGSGEVVIRQR